MKDQYYNMREKLEPVMHIVDLAEAAMKAVGVTPIVKPIRGGTDGSQLSYMGLPCQISLPVAIIFTDAMSMFPFNLWKKRWKLL